MHSIFCFLLFFLLDIPFRIMVLLYPEGEIKEMGMILKGGNAWCEKCEVEFGSDVVPGRGLLAYHLRADEVKFNSVWREKFSVCPLAGRYFRMPELVEDMAMNPIGHPGKPAAASGLDGEARVGSGLPSWIQAREKGRLAGLKDVEQYGGEAAAKLKAEQSSKWMPMIGRSSMTGGEAYRGTCSDCNRPMIEHGPGRECPKEDAEPTGVTGLDTEEFLRLNPKSTLESFAHADAVSEHYAKMRTELNAVPFWPKTAEAEKSAALFRSFPDPGKNSSSAPAVTTPTHVRVENSVLVAEVAAMVHQALMGCTLTTDVADKLILALAGEIHGNVHGDWLTQSKLQQKPGNQPKTLTDEQLFGDPVQPQQRPVDIGGDGVPRVTEPLAHASVSAVDRIQDVTESVLARYPAASGGLSKPIEFTKTNDPKDYPF